MTAALQLCMGSFATLAGILSPQKGLQGGYAVARKRDEKSRAFFDRTSHCGVETA